MCGIIGFNWEDSSLLRKAMKKIAHRGPDASGVFIDNGISLGHKRLSIIDLSDSGKQPMSNEDGNVWITFNGEIYNYKELRENLQKKHEFKSNTDTEILIHLYEERGFDILNYLNGIFAFCIYDMKKKILFIARDHAGIKPLYYYYSGKKFMFCSEIKGILENDEIEREVNLNAINSYFIFRANTGNQSFFKNIDKLQAGHFLVYNLKSNSFYVKKYWDILFKPENHSKKYFSEELKKTLDSSVKSQLMSDVPYGAYLSGGVDSGTIVSLMSKHSSQPIKTFSVGFEEGDDSETSDSRLLAEKLKTDHHELLINKKSIKYLPQIIYHADEPMADPTVIPIFLLSKYAKKYCTVILTGEGADELFGGYPQYKFMKMHNIFIKPMPKPLRKAISTTANLVPGAILNKAFKFSSALGEKGMERFSKFLMSNDYTTEYLSQISIFDKDEQNEILLKNSKRDYRDYEKYFKNTTNKNLTASCRKIDFKESMVDDLLMKLDKNTMAFAIEGRVPFLDKRIIGLSSRIPDNLILNGFTKDKHILREAVKDFVPELTRKRKKKHFFVPIDNWFKDELCSLKQELLSKNYIDKQKIFAYSYINKINKGFEKSKLFYSRQLWALLIFQIWYKQYIENEKIKI